MSSYQSIGRMNTALGDHEKVAHAEIKTEGMPFCRKPCKGCTIDGVLNLHEKLVLNVFFISKHRAIWFVLCMNMFYVFG